MEHQSFAARADNFFEFAFEGSVVSETELFYGDKLRKVGLGDDSLELFVPFCKRPRRIRQFKHHVFDLPPFVLLRRRFAHRA